MKEIHQRQVTAMPENRHLRLFLSLLYIALGLLALWFVFNYALGWLAPFIIAFIVSRIIARPAEFLKEKLRFPRPLAAGLLTVLFYGIIGTALYFSLSAIIKELVVLFERLRNLDINLVVAKLNEKYGEGCVKMYSEFGPIIGTHVATGAFAVLCRTKH